MGDVWLSDDRLISREDWEKFLKEAMDTEITLEFEWDIGERLKYALKAPEILEKAWGMPWKESWNGELKPVLTIYGDNLDILDENKKTWEYNDAVDTIIEFYKQAFMKQLEGF